MEGEEGYNTMSSDKTSLWIVSVEPIFCIWMPFKALPTMKGHRMAPSSIVDPFSLPQSGQGGKFMMPATRRQM